MKIDLNETNEILSTMFSKLAFMLECNISYIANWYFVSDYMSIASNELKIFRFYSVKEKAAYCAIFKL